MDRVGLKIRIVKSAPHRNRKPLNVKLDDWWNSIVEKEMIAEIKKNPHEKVFSYVPWERKTCNENLLIKRLWQGMKKKKSVSQELCHHSLFPSRKVISISLRNQSRLQWTAKMRWWWSLSKVRFVSKTLPGAVDLILLCYNPFDNK